MAGPVVSIGHPGTSSYRVDWGPRQRGIEMGLRGLGDMLAGIAEFEKNRKAAKRKESLSTLIADSLSTDAPKGGPEAPGSTRRRFNAMEAFERAAQLGLAGEPEVIALIGNADRMFNRPEREPKTATGRDGVLRYMGGPRHGQPVFTGAGGGLLEEPAKEDAFAGKLRTMGYTPGTPEYRDAARRLAFRPTTTVDARQMGTIPQDHRAVYDNLGRVSHYEVIPGSPTARKIAAGEATAGERAGGAQERANIVNQHVGAIRQMVADESFLSPVTGMGGSLMQNVPASKAHDMQQRLATLKALVGFKQLNEMRAQSPTGGALGNVTERELGFLQSVIGSLEQSQSQAQFLENLGMVEDAFNRVVHGPPRQMVPGGYQAGGTSPPPPGLALPGLTVEAAPDALPPDARARAEVTQGFGTVPSRRGAAQAATIDPRYMGGVGTVSGAAPDLTSLSDADLAGLNPATPQERDALLAELNRRIAAAEAPR